MLSTWNQHGDNPRVWERAGQILKLVGLIHGSELRKGRLQVKKGKKVDREAEGTEPRVLVGN